MLLLGKRLAECNTTLWHTYKIMLVTYSNNYDYDDDDLLFIIIIIICAAEFGITFRGLRVSSRVKLELSDIDLNIEKGKTNIS